MKFSPFLRHYSSVSLLILTLYLEETKYNIEYFLHFIEIFKIFLVISNNFKEIFYYIIDNFMARYLCWYGRTAKNRHSENYEDT